MTFFVAKSIRIVELIGNKQTETKERYYNSIDVLDSLDSIKGTILVNYKWTPKQVDKLELQSENYKGLFFIYNHIIEEIADTNRKINKKS